MPTCPRWSGWSANGSSNEPGTLGQLTTTRPPRRAVEGGVVVAKPGQGQRPAGRRPRRRRRDGERAADPRPRAHLRPRRTGRRRPGRARGLLRADPGHGGHALRGAPGPDHDLRLRPRRRGLHLPLRMRRRLVQARRGAGLRGRVPARPRPGGPSDVDRGAARRGSDAPDPAASRGASPTPPWSRRPRSRSAPTTWPRCAARSPGGMHGELLAAAEALVPHPWRWP